MTNNQRTLYLRHHGNWKTKAYHIVEMNLEDGHTYWLYDDLSTGAKAELERRLFRALPEMNKIVGRMGF